MSRRAMMRVFQVSTGGRAARLRRLGALAAQFANEVVAVEREAGTDHVVPGLRAGDGGGGVGQVTVAGMQSGGGQQMAMARSKSARWLVGHGRVEDFGFGEMAEDSLQLDHGRGSDAGGQRGKLGERDAEARHAGIDLEMHGNACG